MINGSHYREEARRCRVRAAREPDCASSARWQQLASEYELLADDLDASPPSAAPDRRVRLQQGQQHHATEDRRRLGARVPATD
jgi:hypothetical protein